MNAVNRVVLFSNISLLLPVLLQLISGNARYERLADFKALVKQHDPGGKFQNEFLTKNLYAG